jgi:hypothetical protein
VNLTIVILLFTAITTTAHPQEVKHAPTVAQCQADGRLWLSKLDDENSKSSVSYNTLVDWGAEMKDCTKVDPTQHQLYYDVEDDVLATILDRYLNFIKRHQLYEQFVGEDEAGAGR